MNLKRLLKYPLSDIRFPDFTKIDWELVKEEPWSGNHNDRLDRHRNDAVDALCYAINRLDGSVNESIKTWEEFKNMKKFNRTEIINVGYMKNVFVPVDVKTNLAKIDVTELIRLYKENIIAVDDRDRYLRRTAQLKEVNNQLVEANEEIQKENAELKEENERLINKITNMKLMFNSVYGLPKGCDCHICCVRHAGRTAFAKAAESLAKHLEAGKPTYDQLLEENEKLKRENHSFRRGQESLEAEIDEIDKECDALVEEKEKLQAELEILDRLNADKNNEIKALETRLDNVIKSRKEINDEYTAYVNNNEDPSYYSMWHNLADEYCKLEEKYNKVYVQYEKYKKYCEDFIERIESTKIDNKEE